jgi:hypothetical protein
MVEADFVLLSSRIVTIHGSMDVEFCLFKILCVPVLNFFLCKTWN